ncbi:hypothetical protein CYMTET_26591 [Cymbomonas tetramitiformis]|uniref:Uncharacterized protein n=1 Tax=Cymbomonas tetramitiformis TaxID=36881 RepID=A0AAE0FRR2_9CHLO|nr:hypothetical protein CYMTET_26591 [Cymbomonas tetramitiformis]
MAALGAASGGGGLAALQYLSMCQYLVLSTRAYSDSWLTGTLQYTVRVPWPKTKQPKVTECQPVGEEYTFICIPEADSAAAWNSLINSWILLCILICTTTAAQLAIGAVCGTVPGILSCPRLQLHIIRCGAPGLLQAAGFVLAHADSLSFFEIASALTALLCFVANLVPTVYVLHQGQLVERLWRRDPSKVWLGRACPWVAAYTIDTLEENAQWMQRQQRYEKIAHRWGMLHKSLRPPADGQDVADRGGWLETSRRFFLPICFAKNGLSAFVLGIFVRAVPHCNDPDPAFAGVAQLSLLIALPGVMLCWLAAANPFIDIRWQLVHLLDEATRLASMSCGLLLALGARHHVFVSGLLWPQLVNAAIQMAFQFYTMSIATCDVLRSRHWWRGSEHLLDDMPSSSARNETEDPRSLQRLDTGMMHFNPLVEPELLRGRRQDGARHPDDQARDPASPRIDTLDISHLPHRTSRTSSFESLANDSIRQLATVLRQRPTGADEEGADSQNEMECMGRSSSTKLGSDELRNASSARNEAEDQQAIGRKRHSHIMYHNPLVDQELLRDRSPSKVGALHPDKLEHCDLR